MDEAHRHLKPHLSSHRKSLPVGQKKVEKRREETRLTLEYLESRGVDTERPKKRSECPTQRPCPFVSCRYHLYLDVNESGTIKFNFHGIEPWEMKESCVLDITDKEIPLTLNDVGEHMSLVRERVRQIELSALQKIEKEMDLTKIIGDLPHVDTRKNHE